MQNVEFLINQCCIYKFDILYPITTFIESTTHFLVFTKTQKQIITDVPQNYIHQH